MRCSFVTLAALLVVTTALAQSSDPRQLTVRPASEPVPALKYPLLPPMSDMSPGNAVTLYYRAMTPDWLWHRREKDIDAKMESWRKTPLKDLPRTEMAWLSTYRPLQDYDTAARREQCDWDLMARLRKTGAGTLLGDVQAVREVARLLVLRGRLEIANGEYDKAVATVQTLLAVSRHVSDTPILINFLIGCAIAQQAFELLEEFVQTPGAPNLYWSLTALPRPLLDLRKPLEGERLMIVSSVPTLAALHDVKVLETQALPPHQLHQLRRELATMAKGVLDQGAPEEDDFKKFDAVIDKLAPVARKALIAAGRPAADVEKLPALQVVTWHGMQRHRQLLDDAVKLTSLPYWEARPRLEEFDNRTKEATDEMVVFLRHLILGLHKVPNTQVRVDRRIAALRCVEALRLHVAANGGKLPEKLADIKKVPVPIDPVTGKEFEFKAVGNRFTLTGPPPSGESATPQNTLAYEVSLAR